MSVLKTIPQLSSDPENTIASLEGISVAIPHYNCQNYLLETLESVYKAKAANMEIFVVDDQTPDFNIREFLDANGYRDVRAYVNSKNLGSFATFNECIKHANRKLVHVLHADDTVEQSFYKEVYRAFEEHDRLEAFFCAAEIIDHQSRRLNKIRPAEPLEVPYELNFLSQNPIRTPAVVIKKAAFEKVGLYRIDLPHTADWDLWIRLVLNCNSFYLDQPLCNYRVFEGSRTNLQRRQGKAWYGIVKIHYIMVHEYKLHSLKKRFLLSARLSSSSLINCIKRTTISRNRDTLNYSFESLSLSTMIVPVLFWPMLPCVWFFAIAKKIFTLISSIAMRSNFAAR